MDRFFYFRIFLSLAGWVWNMPFFNVIKKILIDFYLFICFLYLLCMYLFSIVKSYSTTIQSTTKNIIIMEYCPLYLWKVVCSELSASRRGRVNMASEQVRYVPYLLLFLRFSPPFLHLVNGTLIYMFLNNTQYKLDYFFFFKKHTGLLAGLYRNISVTENISGLCYG